MASGEWRCSCGCGSWNGCTRPCAALPYYGFGICHCIGDGQGNPCIGCPNIPAQQYYQNPFEVYRAPFVPLAASPSPPPKKRRHFEIRRRR